MTHPAVLIVTSRADLRAKSGVGVHLAFDPSVYQRPEIVQLVIDGGWGLVRDRYWPNDKDQTARLLELGKAGVRLYLYAGQVGGTTPEQAAANVRTLAASPLAPYVAAVCGPNEPNANGGDTWPAKTIAMQAAIDKAVDETGGSFPQDIQVVGPALKHNLPGDHDLVHYKADLAALAALELWKYVDALDHHFYPGNGGPVLNQADAAIVTGILGDLPLWHSETGWTGADTDPDTAGRFTVEALLRNHLAGIVGTIIYGLADDAQHEDGREAMFGTVYNDLTPKPAYDAVRALLAGQDAGEAFPGWEALHARSDATPVITSDSGGTFTLYLLKGADSTYTLALPAGSPYRCDAGTYSPGRVHGVQHWTIDLDQTMTVVHATPR